MPTIRLVPSTIYNDAGTSYLSVTNPNNAYTNTDSDTYATIQNLTSSTSNRYIYLRGFNFDDIPNAAVISSWTVKLKARESGISTSTSYKPYCANGTTAINGTCDVITTTAAVYTFSGFTNDWDDIVAMGDNFGIRINCRRASRNTTGYMYIYGAEIEVTYTVPDPRIITTTLNGNGTISPSGTTTAYDGDEFELTITPTDKTAAVTATKDGVDITSQLVGHYSGSGTASAVLGTYTLISGGFNGSGASYFQGIVGNGYDTNEITTSNYYSSGSGTRAVFQYAMPIAIPSGATITRCYMMANGHCENASQSSEYMCVQLKSGSTELTEQYNFKEHGTSNGTETIEATVLPTAAQCSSLVVECTLGYYGGAINGVTVFVEYETPSANYDYYTYTYEVSGNATIAVTIGGSIAQPELYVKLNGSWVEVTAAYKKVNGSWVLQSDVTSIFDSGTNYVHG